MWSKDKTGLNLEPNGGHLTNQGQLARKKESDEPTESLGGLGA